ncbi:MAG: hypothetical protein B7Z55_19000, partial [Planctomycetales bacterium 12-60-4]
METMTELEPTSTAADTAEHRVFLDQFETPHRPVTPGELVLAIAALVAWFGLFAGGLLVGTEPHRTRIADPTVTTVAVADWMIVLSFWTITNIGVLSCVAAFLGAFGNRAQFIRLPETAPAQNLPPAHWSFDSLWTYYTSAVMRGFGVYTLSLAGLLVLSTASLVRPTQDDYLRLAPLLSIIAFYGGYDSTVFGA